MLRKLLIILGILILSAKCGFAQEVVETYKNWIDQSPWGHGWNDPENWYPNFVPEPGDSVIVTSGLGQWPDYDTQWEISYDDLGYSEPFYSLTVDGGMVLSINSGTFKATNQYIGRDSLGTVLQNGGSNYADYLYLSGGDLSYEEWGSTGTQVGYYQMNGGDLFVDSYLFVGGFKDLSDWRYDGGFGNFQLISGNIYADQEYIGGFHFGSDREGVFNQSGGVSSNSFRTLDIEGGTYILGVGGELEGNTESISGLFQQDAGNHTVSNLDLFGNYNMTGGNLTVGNKMIVDRGSFMMDQGLITVNELEVDGSLISGEVGIFTMNDGSLQAGGYIYLGRIGGESVFNQNGGIVTVDPGQGYQIYTFHSWYSDALQATYNLNGGIVNAGLFRNDCNFNYRGGEIVANLYNTGNVLLEASSKVPLIVDGETRNFNNFEIRNSNARFSGSVVNENTGILKVIGSTVTYEGTFTNYGVYNSDPSINNFQADLNIGTTGYLLGSTGDIFNLYADLHSASTSSAWNTQGATLAFIGGGNHELELVSPQSFIWGTLELGAGTGIDFLGDKGSLRVNKLIVSELSQLSNIDLSLNIYSDGIYKPGGTELYDLAGFSMPSNVQVTPEPISSALFLIGAGMLTGIKRFRKKA